MAVRLTDAGIKKLQPRAERYDVSDAGTPGLQLRTWPNGAKRWSIWYRTATGARRLALGPYGTEPPALTLAKARTRARQVVADVQRGADPQGDKRRAREAKRARRDAAKLSDLLDAFVKDQGPRWRPSTKAGWERFIKADIKPHLGKRIPSELTADDVARFVDKLKAVRGPVSVARAYEVLRRALTWARATRRLAHNPCSGLDASELVQKAQTSDRVYADDELLGIVAGAAVTELRLLVPWIAYTGSRQGEACAAEWKEVDKKARVWTVPAEKSKSGVQHRVPLSAGAMAVLDELDAKSRWLFPAETSSGHIAVNSKTLLKVRRVSGVADFKPHDLRRTVRQRLTDAGVALHVAEACIGHLPSKLVRTYSPQWEPMREMAAALEAWGREVSRVARGEERRAADVVAIESARA